MPSWPLILKDDPSVLFTSAGMQPLVPYFLGKKQPPAKRIVAVQKVFRATDIDEVGKDDREQERSEQVAHRSSGNYLAGGLARRVSVLDLGVRRGTRLASEPAKW